MDSLILNSVHPYIYQFLNCSSRKIDRFFPLGKSPTRAIRSLRVLRCVFYGACSAVRVLRRVFCGACSAVRVLRRMLSGPYNAQPGAEKSEFKCLQALDKRCKLTADFHA